MSLYGPICGQPMRFYELGRVRTDLFPVCHRPPHEGPRHMSKASMDRERERSRANRWRYDKLGHIRPGPVLSEGADSVTDMRRAS